MDNSNGCEHQGAPANVHHENVTVIYEAADGEVWTPWTKEGKPPKGMRRRELRGTELAKFERQMNRKERDRYMAARRRREEYFAPMVDAQRKQLLHDMRGMNPRARAFAEAAIELNNRKRTYNERYEAGFRREG